MSHEVVLLALFGIAMAVAVAARWLAVPYTVALVVAGLVLGATHALAPPHLTRQLLYDAILPGLLFEAAFHLEFDGLARSWRAIVTLAVPGVVAAIALTTVVLVPVVRALGVAPGFGVAAGVVFAAMIAATDPIAVVAMFKSLGVPRRLATLVEAESLFNDGTAIVFFTLILGAVTTGHVDPLAAGFDFVRVVGVGLAIGALVGLVAARLVATFEDPMLAITVTTLAAYGSFVVAEHLGFSGVIATVTTGLVCGNHRAHTHTNAATRLAVVSFWQYVAFALNSVVFLLIGFEVHLRALLASWPAILAAYVAVTLSRGAVALLVSLGLRRTTERLSGAWTAVLAWGGLRGALSMVLALGLPAEFPHRATLVTMTFGVVVLSILLQGLTMGPLLRRVGLARVHASSDVADVARGALVASTAALGALDAIAQQQHVAPEIAAALRARFRAQADAASARIGAPRAPTVVSTAEARRTIEQQLVDVQKDAVRVAARAGAISAEAAQRVIADLDAARVDPDAPDDADPPP